MVKNQFHLGPSVECELTDMPEEDTIRIRIMGVFRHDHLTHDQIKEQLLTAFREIDMDS